MDNRAAHPHQEKGGGGGICTHTSIIITYHMGLRINIWEIFIIFLKVV